MYTAPAAPTTVMLKVDAGHASLTTLARTYGQLVLSNANEAETRLKVIDDVVFSVLGWQKHDVTVEERVSEDGHTRFADYIIRTASTALLIEAKRAAASFVFPRRHVRLRLSGVLSEGLVGAAIRQARDYCRRKSIPFAVVTNGSAWIVFPATRTDQVPFEDSEARTFRDLDDVATRFVEFWELLSRERTLDGNLAHELLGRSAREDDLLSRTVRQILPEPGYRLGRNALYDHIEPAISAALTDEALLDNPDALEKCYVKTSERLKYDARLQVHLRDHRPPLGHTTTRIKSRRHELKPEKQLATVTTKGPRKFIVLLGPVGAGKTTFLHYTRKVSAAAAITNKVLWFLIDFKKATQADPPRRFILRELLTAIESDSSFDLGDWRKTIRPAYATRIAALKRGPMCVLAETDPDGFERGVAQEITSEREAVEPYVEAILRWASAKWPGFLIIDNVDQIEDVTQQDSIFAEAQALARRVNLNVVMSLRESTFLKHRERPVFDAFEFDSFYVDPPNVIPVLARRFTLAKKILEGTRIELRTEQGMRVKVPDLGVFFDIVSQSLLGQRTGLLIEALAGGNVRRGLALVREFLASGHTNADHAIATYLSDGDFRFPRHEVFRGAVLGRFRYFNDSNSLLPNLLDAKLAAPTLQLLRLQIVALLVDRAANGVTEGALVSEVASACSRMGVPEADFLQVIQDLNRRGMCRSVDGLPVSRESAVVPTRLAAYAIREMCQDFAYLDFCSVDSAIHDPEALRALQDITFEAEAAQSATERVKLRGARVELFINYLVRCEERWIVEARRRELGGEWQLQTVENYVKPGGIKSAAAALQSALRRYGTGTAQKTDRTDASTVPVDEKTYKGRVVDCWADKEYVFIREDDGTDWFSHRRDFVIDGDWEQRKRKARCVFLRGQWNGRPRATSVRLRR